MHRLIRRTVRPLAVLAAAATCAALLLPQQAPAAAADEQVVTLDGESAGRTFDGIGALSAGASSRLLVDYPEPARSRILDYLFTPGYGAELQILRVEIGGDVNSTAGSEPSHMRAATDLDCDRGYEWWLMREAKQRNPDIVLSGLSWGAPGWFDGGFWSQDNIDHLVAWLDCAQHHGLSIDYLGGWNESEDFEPSWFVALDEALEANGHADTKIIAADGWGADLAERWKVADVMAADDEFRDAVDVLSVHYPCGQQYNGAPFDHCPSTQAAQDLGVPLWSGEQGSQKYDIGAGPLAKAINRSYIDGRMTATVNWAMTASFYTSIPYAGVGLMRAYQPWSGYFETSKSLWSMAHTGQFAEPGWRYLDDASGYLDSGGSYVTLRSPDTGDYSVVIESVDAESPQTVSFEIPDDAGLSTAPVQVWRTDLRSDQHADWFTQEATVRPDDGAYRLTVQPGHVYTLTTTAGQGQGKVGTFGTDRAMKLPYRDDFDATPHGRSPRLLSDFNGAFEAVDCPGRRGRCVEQVVTTEPIAWRYTTHTTPLTVLGDPHWFGDYRVAVDARVDQAQHVDLLGRVDGVQLGAGGQPGYRLRLDRSGRWTLIEYASDRTETALAEGRLDRFHPRQWHRLSLAFRGEQLSAFIDNRRVARVDDARHNRGQVGLMVGDWQRAQFDNLTITPTGPSPVLVPQGEISATATNAHLGYEAANVLDANPNSMWHTSWEPQAPLPQSITLDLGRRRPATALLYTPRYDSNPNANITEYTVHVSSDGDSFTPVTSGSWPADGATKAVALPPGRVRYIRLEAHAGNGYAGAAELNVALTPVRGAA